MMEPTRDETKDERIEALYRIARQSAQALLVIDQMEGLMFAGAPWSDALREVNAEERVH
jgi:hypothetical protein